jgi:hypothetical protein
MGKGKSIDVKKGTVELGATNKSLVRNANEIPRNDRLATPRRK